MSAPFICPVCGGRGTKPGWFYELGGYGGTTSLPNHTVTCRACLGKGYVWDGVPRSGQSSGGCVGANS